MTSRSPKTSSNSDGVSSRDKSYLVFAAVSFALTVLIYGFLIWSNCGSTGPSSFFTDVVGFHSAEGC